MIAKRCSMMVMASGLACAAASAQQPVLTSAEVTPAEATPVGHLYINMRTGERVFTLFTDDAGAGGGGGGGSGVDRAGPGVFINDDNPANGNAFWKLDDPTRTGTIPPFGTEGADWGDMPFDTVIDGFSFGYATDAAIAIAPVFALPGFSMINWFYDCDNGNNDPAAIPSAVFLLSSAPAAVSPIGYSAWIISIDFAPYAFAELGDLDGTAASPATGTFKINGGQLGCDKDDTNGDPWSDFGWSYSFVQGQIPAHRGVAGPLLVLPLHKAMKEDDINPTGGGGSAHGVNDAVDWYSTPTNPSTFVARSGHLGTYNFGGWPANPYASLYIALYGYDPCTLADLNGDTVSDILDMLDFFDAFSTCQGCTIPAACPPATFAMLDRYNPDGCVDILDMLEFLYIFGHCY